MEIEIDSTQPEQLQQAIRLVEQTKGGLSAEPRELLSTDEEGDSCPHRSPGLRCV
jgi:hypothetical protein